MNITDKTNGHRKLMFSLWYYALKEYASDKQSRRGIRKWVRQDNPTFGLCAGCMDMHVETLREKTDAVLERLDDGAKLKPKHFRTQVTKII